MYKMNSSKNKIDFYLFSIHVCTKHDPKAYMNNYVSTFKKYITTLKIDENIQEIFNTVILKRKKLSVIAIKNVKKNNVAAKRGRPRLVKKDELNRKSTVKNNVKDIQSNIKYNKKDEIITENYKYKDANKNIEKEIVENLNANNTEQIEKEVVNSITKENTEQNSMKNAERIEKEVVNSITKENTEQNSMKNAERIEKEVVNSRTKENIIRNNTKNAEQIEEQKINLQKTKRGLAAAKKRTVINKRKTRINEVKRKQNLGKTIRKRTDIEHKKMQNLVTVCDAVKETSTNNQEKEKQITNEVIIDKQNIESNKENIRKNYISLESIVIENVEPETEVIEKIKQNIEPELMVIESDSNAFDLSISIEKNIKKRSSALAAEKAYKLRLAQDKELRLPAVRRNAIKRKRRNINMPIRKRKTHVPVKETKKIRKKTTSHIEFNDVYTKKESQSNTIENNITEKIDTVQENIIEIVNTQKEIKQNIKIEQHDSIKKINFDKQTCNNDDNIQTSMQNISSTIAVVENIKNSVNTQISNNSIDVELYRIKEENIKLKLLLEQAKKHINETQKCNEIQEDVKTSNEKSKKYNTQDESSTKLTNITKTTSSFDKVRSYSDIKKEIEQIFPSISESSTKSQLQTKNEKNNESTITENDVKKENINDALQKQKNKEFFVFENRSVEKENINITVQKQKNKEFYVFENKSVEKNIKKENINDALQKQKNKQDYIFENTITEKDVKKENINNLVQNLKKKKSFVFETNKKIPLNEQKDVVKIYNHINDPFNHITKKQSINNDFFDINEQNTMKQKIIRPDEKLGPQTDFFSMKRNLLKKVLDDDIRKTPGKKKEESEIKSISNPNDYEPKTVLPFIDANDKAESWFKPPEWINDANLVNIIKRQKHKDLEIVFFNTEDLDVVKMFPEQKNVTNDSPNRWPIQR